MVEEEVLSVKVLVWKCVPLSLCRYEYKTDISSNQLFIGGKIMINDCQSAINYCFHILFGRLDRFLLDENSKHVC